MTQFELNIHFSIAIFHEYIMSSVSNQFYSVLSTTFNTLDKLYSLKFHSCLRLVLYYAVHLNHH